MAPDLTADPADQSRRAKTSRDYSRIARREEIYGFWSSVIFDEDEETKNRNTAAVHLHDRLFGSAPATAHDETASGYIDGPPVAETMDEWTQRAKARQPPAEESPLESSGGLAPKPGSDGKAAGSG